MFPVALPLTRNEKVEGFADQIDLTKIGQAMQILVVNALMMKRRNELNNLVAARLDAEGLGAGEPRASLAGNSPATRTREILL